MDNNKQGTKMRLRSSITPEERDEVSHNFYNNKTSLFTTLF